MSVQTVWNALASNFGNDRNLKAGQWGVPADRQGGGRIGEALIYTSELSDGQRAQVEAYLMKKWLRKTLGIVRVASGATLSATATNALDLTKVTGAGTLAVTGAGHIALPDTENIAVPPIALDVGASASGTLCQRPGQPFALTGGASYEAANGVCTRTALADTTIASKTGSGVLTVSSIDEDVASVNVTEGTLRLAPPLQGVSEVLTGALQNGSFEYQDGSRSPNENGLIYLENVTYGSWTFTFGAGGNCGLAHYSGAFCNKQPPEGDWVMFLVNDCTVSQNFTVSDSGRYEVSFYTATGANANWPWHLYQVLIDGTTVIGSIRTSELGFQHVLCRTPSLATGAHTLTFNGVLEANRVSLIDNVEIRPCIEADEVEVPNGGFEVPSVLTMKSSDERPYANFQTAPIGASWTFSSGDGLYTGTTEGYSTWRYTGMDEGGHAAILSNSSTNGSRSINYGLMSVPLTFPTAGVYRITFKAASRTGRYNGFYNRWNDNSALDGNTVAVALDGVEAARPTTPGWLGDFTSYEFILPPVTNGAALTQTLSFQIIAPDWYWFSTILIDDVRVFRMPPIANPGFEDVSETGLGWTLNRGSVECGITTPGQYSWTVTSPEGGALPHHGERRQRQPERHLRDLRHVRALLPRGEGP